MRSTLRFTVVLLSMLIALAPAHANTPDRLAEAARHYAAEPWADAARAYADVVEADETNGRAWFRLGRARLMLDDAEGAIPAFLGADAVPFLPHISRYFLARAYARAMRPDEALTALARAAAAGYANAAALAEEPDLAGLRDDPRYADIATMVDRNANPRAWCPEPEARQFDFWLGEWDVTGPDGTVYGTNSITRDMNGCMLVERWQSASGGTGTSINFFDPTIDGWRQVWVNPAGGNIMCEGGIEDGAMVLRGRNTARDGTSERYIMTFTPLDDGRVRQFVQQSKDDGETWYTWFDGYYARRTAG